MRRILDFSAKPSLAVAVAASLAVLLSACETGNEEKSEAEKPTAKPTPTLVKSKGVTAAPGDTEGVTPMKERVATISLLNKRNNDQQDFEMRPGEVVEAGKVILRLSACERTAPYEFPQETGAFVQVDVLERGNEKHTRVHSGWLFKNSPSRNVVEHPVYDVWVKDCAMRFPGEDPLPEPGDEAEAEEPSEEDGAAT